VERRKCKELDHQHIFCASSNFRRLLFSHISFMSLVQPLLILLKQYVIAGCLQGLQWPGGCQRFVSADPTLCSLLPL
jgi:hypothetical protein